MFHMPDPANDGKAINNRENDYTHIFINKG
jgi:hypothetical protein